MSGVPSSSKSMDADAETDADNRFTSQGPGIVVVETDLKPLTT